MNRWSLATVSASTVVAAAAALPWVAIGPRRVSGFGLVTIARHFGYARSATGIAGTGWFCVPLLAGLAVAATLAGRTRTGVLLGAVVGVAGAVVAGLVIRASGGGSLVGVRVTFAAAVVVIVCAPFGLRRTDNNQPGGDR